MNITRHTYRKEAEEGEDLGGGEAVEEQNKGKDAGAEAGEGGEPEVSADIIAKAEKMGWTPKDQFKGDPAKWRPADEFVERGESMLPLLRAQVKRQDREIAALKQSMAEFGEFHSKTAQREYERALTDLRQKRADAIKDGDGVAFDKVDQEIATLRKDIEAKGPKAPKQIEEASPEFQEWLGKNKWANDPKLQAIGLGISEGLRADGETATGIELLDLVAAEVKRRYPEKFENPRRNAAPSVEGGSGGPRKGGGKSFADMPADARQACDRMAKSAYDGKPEEAAKFKANYVKSFFEQEA